MTTSLTLHSVIFLLFLSTDAQLEKFATQTNIPSFQLLIFYSLAKNARLGPVHSHLTIRNAIMGLLVERIGLV